LLDGSEVIMRWSVLLAVPMMVNNTFVALAAITNPLVIKNIGLEWLLLIYITGFASTAFFFLNLGASDK
jgi:hypothetical protein